MCVPQVGLRVHALLINHMQQYRYNAAGALRWKCDITEYVDVIRAWDVPGLRDKLLEVQVSARVWFCAAVDDRMFYVHGMCLGSATTHKKHR